MSSVYDKPTVLASPPVVQPFSATHVYSTPTPQVSASAPAISATHMYAQPTVVTNINAPVFDPNHVYAKPRK